MRLNSAMGLPNRAGTFSYMICNRREVGLQRLGDNWLACVEGVTLPRNANQRRLTPSNRQATQTNGRPTPSKRQATQTKRQSNAKRTPINRTRGFLSII
jgi:hypothetical protein